MIQELPSQRILSPFIVRVMKITNMQTQGNENTYFMSIMFLLQYENLPIKDNEDVQEKESSLLTLLL